MLSELTFEKNINLKMFKIILAFWLLSHMITYYTVIFAIIINFQRNVVTIVIWFIEIIFFNKQFLCFVGHRRMEFYWGSNGSVTRKVLIKVVYKELKRFFTFINWNHNLRRSNSVFKNYFWQIKMKYFKHLAVQKKTHKLILYFLMCLTIPWNSFPNQKKITWLW